VSAAASIAVHLGQRGFTVRLVTSSGDDLSTTWHTRDPELNTRAMLEALAVVQPVTNLRIDTGWLAESTHGGLLLAVIGAINEADGPMLRRMHHHAGTALALALDVAAWGPTNGAGQSTGTHSARPLLARQGWRAVTLRSRDRLDLVWQDLGRTSAHAARSGAVDEIRPVTQASR
jgi:hypothetical protein